MNMVGKTFLMPASLREPPHLHIVVAQDGDELALVNITDADNVFDTTVILQPGEHPYIHKPSAVFYQKAKISSMKLIKDAIDSFTTPVSSHADCSQDLLAKVQAGVLASDHTPQKVQVFCDRVWYSGWDNTPPAGQDF